MKTYVYLWQYLTEFFLVWGMFKVKVVEKIKTHILGSVTFFLSKTIPFMRQCGKTMQSHTSHRWQHNMTHVHCMLDNEGYRHTLRICNTYCYFTATMVTWMHLNIMLYIHCLSCYTIVLSSHDQFWWTGMRLWDWQVGFPHSLSMEKITLSSVKLSFIQNS